MARSRNDDATRLNEENAHMLGKVVRYVSRSEDHPDVAPLGSVGVVEEVTFLHAADNIPYLVKWFDTRYKSWWVGPQHVEVCDDGVQ